MMHRRVGFVVAVAVLSGGLVGLAAPEPRSRQPAQAQKAPLLAEPR